MAISQFFFFFLFIRVILLRRPPFSGDRLRQGASRPIAPFPVERGQRCWVRSSCLRRPAESGLWRAGGGVGTRPGGAPVGRLFFARFPPRFLCGAPRGTLSGALGAGVGKGGVVGWEAGGIREGLDK